MYLLFGRLPNAKRWKIAILVFLACEFNPFAKPESSSDEIKCSRSRTSANDLVIQYRANDVVDYQKNNHKKNMTVKNSIRHSTFQTQIAILLHRKHTRFFSVDKLLHIYFNRLTPIQF